MRSLIIRATLIYAVVCGALAACAAMGLNPTPTPQEAVAQGYTAVATVRNTANEALKAGKISVKEAQTVQGIADQARAALDIAVVALQAGKPADAQSALNLANQVVGQLTTFLQQHGS